MELEIGSWRGGWGGAAKNGEVNIWDRIIGWEKKKKNVDKDELELEF